MTESTSAKEKTTGPTIEPEVDHYRLLGIGPERDQ